MGLRGKSTLAYRKKVERLYLTVTSTLVYYLWARQGYYYLLNGTTLKLAPPLSLAKVTDIDKHSSLSRHGIDYIRKKLYMMAPSSIFSSNITNKMSRGD
jgi:hypothetical protein